jgi:hypothetical protein
MGTERRLLIILSSVKFGINGVEHLDSVTQKLVVTQGKFFSAFDFFCCAIPHNSHYTL